MTKLRPPVSFQQAVTGIAGRIGWAEAAQEVGKSERTVRNWSDPDSDALPSIVDALRLDSAFLAAGGGEPPIMAVYAMQLDRRVEGGADAVALAAATARAAKEAGEAIGAMVLASQPGATSTTRAHAEHETQEAIEAFSGALAKLGPPAKAATPTGGDAP